MDKQITSRFVTSFAEEIRTKDIATSINRFGEALAVDERI